MPHLGRLLIVAGGVLVAAGLLLLLAPRLPWIGTLPGDLRFQRGNTEIFIPLATSILFSALMSALVWLASWFRNKD